MLKNEHLKEQEKISAKKRQIIDGARRIFLKKGFDGASIADIVKEADVSKGTLYAHFASKEKLFETFIFDDRRRQAEQLFNLEANDQSVEVVLFELGRRFVELISSQEAVLHLRTVIGVASKFPDIGLAYYKAGPEFGIKKLSAYFDKQVIAGILDIQDTKFAAMQFMDLCKSGIHMPLMLGISNQVPSELVKNNIIEAIDIFMLKYRKRN